MGEGAMKTITAADANRKFSGLLREVRDGGEVTILSRGKPVAKITSVSSRTFQKNTMKTLLLSRLKGQKATGTRNWTRDDLYDV
jgi:prevent-host-death family protein